ncbi:MAG TPA: hypothetical protein VIL34_22330 [Actinopolymorphaceae bacterium]|jgi:hypothetical protein
MSDKPAVWLLVAQADDPATPYVLATLGWLAADVGALIEAYQEAPREGLLFSSTGSTVLGGDHLGLFAMLCARFEVTAFVLGNPQLLASSLWAFDLPIAASADEPQEFYARAFDFAERPLPDLRLTGTAQLAAYLYPEIVHRRALGFPDRGERIVADSPADVAKRWLDSASGVAFGDPSAIQALLPRLIRENRVALFAPAPPVPAASVRFSAYTERVSPDAGAAADLALATANRVMVGRQTGDGDLFEWSRRGVCLQIAEPDRPAFSVLASKPVRWSRDASVPEEYSDAELRAFAAEGRVLAAMVWHSGEIAHNEAMLNLLDLVGSTGLKVGIGVHAERYLTCPQWELISVSRERGGLRGLVEPLLHSGGRGVLAEYDCPPDALHEHCVAALETIASVAGAKPDGYYAFCDTDLTTMAPARAEVYEAIRRAGLSYVVSSARPGRNAILYQAGDFCVVNQSARSVAGSSPFVRVTTVEELRENTSPTRPGWVLATLDAPVIAFAPYIWRHGSRFMKLVDWFTDASERLNVLPRTVVRYARILREEGYLP